MAPYCKSHARSILGIVLKPCDTGCGVFAARTFKRGDVVAPYLGRRYERHETPPVSPYLMQDVDDAVVDCSIQRSWGCRAVCVVDGRAGLHPW